MSIAVLETARGAEIQLFWDDLVPDDTGITEQSINDSFDAAGESEQDDTIAVINCIQSAIGALLQDKHDITDEINAIHAGEWQETQKAIGELGVMGSHESAQEKALEILSHATEEADRREDLQQESRRVGDEAAWLRGQRRKLEEEGAARLRRKMQELDMQRLALQAKMNRLVSERQELLKTAA